jgi:DNA-3-methyladenine glycosylase II
VTAWLEKVSYRRSTLAGMTTELSRVPFGAEPRQTQLRERHRTVLAATPPYSLDRSLRAMTGFSPCAGDQSVRDGRVRKAFAIPGRDGPDDAVVVEVGPPPDGTAGVTLVVHAADPVDASEAGGVERAVGRWLGLDDDLADFLSMARADPPMRPVLAATEGLHQVRFASLAEGAAYFTLTQRSTQWFAGARKRTIAAQLGPGAELDGQRYVAFPSLPRLLSLSVDDLVRFAGNQQRATRLAGVLAGVAALDEEWLRSAPYDEARKALLGVRGVGAFTAHAILLRVLGRPDDAPVEMAQFTRVAEEIYGDPPPSPAELREWYSGHLGWWAYLGRTGLSWIAAGEPTSDGTTPDGTPGGTAADGTTPGETTPGGMTADGTAAVASPGRPDAGVADGQVEAGASDSSQRNSVRTPQPVAPLTRSPSAESAQAGDDMSRCAHRSAAAPTNSRRYSAAITEPPPISVELTRSATSLSSAST